MQRLAWEGLIEVRPRAGILIAPMHPGDWGRVIDARKGLEALIAVAAAHDRSIRRKGAIRAAHEAMLDAARASDVMGFLKADKLLDEAVAASVDNIFAVRAAAPLQSHARRFWFRYHQKVDLVASARAHAVMVEAILENDADAAGRAATTLMTMLATLAARAAMA
jgi:DNA-binding GntR family transcriptional regulator